MKINTSHRKGDKISELSGSINTRGIGPSEKQLKDQWY